MPAKLAAILPPDVTVAEIIALRAALIAGTAPEDGDALAAMRVILSSSAKPDQTAPDVREGPPVLPSTEERRRAVAEQLGIQLETERDE